MKPLKLIPFFLLFLLASCSSVRVNADYDKQVNFEQYKTYAYIKASIDKVEISDLDKRRILRAIENELKAKGMVVSDNPDVLVNIFTKSREKIDVYNNSYHGWYPWYYGPNFGPQISTYTEGTLFIDLIDKEKNEC